MCSTVCHILKLLIILLPRLSPDFSWEENLAGLSLSPDFHTSFDSRDTMQRWSGNYFMRLPSSVCP